MRILKWNEFLETGFPEEYLTAITVGIFDGVHRGHIALIERIVRQSRLAKDGHENQKQFLPVIITFAHNLKRSAHAEKKYPGDISSFRQKIALFESLGAAITVVADLTQSFRSMTGKEFFRLLREHCKMGYLAVGSNFRCGFHQDTHAAMIKELNLQEHIQTDIVEVLTEEGTPISSSRIRKALIQGNLKEAEAMLGRPFILDIRDTATLPAALPVERSAYPAEASEGDLILDIAALGRILPPPGTYSVLLHSSRHAISSGHTTNNTSKSAEIIIQKGYIRLPGSPECDFIEFLS